MKPITPDEASKNKKFVLPDFVIKAFNETITKHWNGKQSQFKQEEVYYLILKYAPVGTTGDMLFNNHWLDIEPMYEKAGWNVEYDKSGFNEDYPTMFIFTRKTK